MCKHKFNEQGYCKRCGHYQFPAIFFDAPPEDGLRSPAPVLDGRWPVGTWFQKQLALVRVKELQRVNQEGSNSHA
jgi:hypothetical protein